MFGFSVEARCRPWSWGNGVLRSSARGTLAYLTEPWPAYAHVLEMVPPTSAFDGFGPRLMRRHHSDIINSIHHIGDPRPTFMQLRQI